MTTLRSAGEVSTGHPLLDLLLNPALWWVLAGLWVFRRWRERQCPPVGKEYNRKKKNKPGDLFADGSSATSKTEKKVREVIEKAGYKLYPPSTRMYTFKDNEGKNRLYTPDILIKRPKMIVEVDPHYYHGDPRKVAHDIDRNRAYARLGYTIVRVRIDGTEALSPNDVVIGESGFDPDRDRAKLLKGLRRAKFFPSKYWANAQRYMPKTNPAADGLVPNTHEYVQRRSEQQRAMYPGQDGYLGMPGSGMR